MTDISRHIVSHIGALEIGAVISTIGDGALEAQAAYGPIHSQQCPPTMGFCTHVNDGALEAAADSLYADPTGNPPICRMSGPLMCPRHIDDSFVDDGALEAATTAIAGPTSSTLCMQTVRSPQGCRIDALSIDDGALEASAASMASPSYGSVCLNTNGPMCPKHIEDGALENISSAFSASPTTSVDCKMTIHTVIGCRIDDGALEAATTAMAGPTSSTLCMQTVRSPQGCRIDALSIDDGALEAEGMAPGTTVITYCGCGHVGGHVDTNDETIEASALSMAGPPQAPTSSIFCPPHIDDSALEAAASAKAGPTMAPCTVMTCPRIDERTN